MTPIYQTTTYIIPTIGEKEIHLQHPMYPRLPLIDPLTTIEDYVRAFESIAVMTYANAAPKFLIAGAIEEPFIRDLTKMLYDYFPDARKLLYMSPTDMTQASTSFLRYISINYDAIYINFHGQKANHELTYPDTYDATIKGILELKTGRCEVVAVNEVTFYNVQNLAASMLFLLENKLSYFVTMDLELSYPAQTEEEANEAGAEMISTLLEQLKILEDYDIYLYDNLYDSLIESLSRTLSTLIVANNVFQSHTTPTVPIVSMATSDRLAFNTPLLIGETLQNYIHDKEAFVSNRKIKDIERCEYIACTQNNLYIALVNTLRRYTV